jgi:catechol 2,3-dioxygenase-like lactoylglutathione lyase family enzyme
MPPIEGLLETALYVEDVQRAAEFYQRLFGFEKMVADERFCALNVAGKQVLLLFKRGSALQPTVLPGGTIPPHDGVGHLHFAFAIAASDLDAWEAWLAQQGVVIESRVAWERGSRSLYFRDPDQHLVELATPGLWPIY